MPKILHIFQMYERPRESAVSTPAASARYVTPCAPPLHGSLVPAAPSIEHSHNQTGTGTFKNSPPRAYTLLPGWTGTIQYTDENHTFLEAKFSTRKTAPPPE